MRESPTDDSRSSSERFAEQHPRTPAVPVWDPEVERISLLRLLNVLLRFRRLLMAASLLGFSASVAVGLLGPRDYTASTAFMPQAAEGQISQLAGLAAQFGVSAPTMEAGRSPSFYVALLGSRGLLRSAVESEYEFAVDAGSGVDTLRGDLVELFEVEEESRPLEITAAIEELRDKVEVRTHSEAGLVELSITTRWPVLSRQIAERMLELVGQFNLETRRSQASAERRFIEDRLESVRRDMIAAEDSLEGFLERNRLYENSPPLRFEYERLQQRLSLHRQVFTSLSQSYEKAKIDEVRNTPVITVVDSPETPAKPNSRQLVLRGVLGLFLGGLVGLMWAFGRRFVESSREHEPDDYREFAELRRQSRADLRRVWRFLRHPLGGRSD